MSQLSIGISIKLDISGGLSAGAGGEAYNEHNAWSPPDISAQADTNAAWTLLTGTAAGTQQTSNTWYPAKTSGYTGVRWSTLPVTLVSSDNYMEFEAIDAWTGSGDYIGPALRMASDQTSFYAFLVSGDDKYILRKVFEGAVTDAKTGDLGAVIVATDIIRIEVEGDVVRGLINGELVDSFTDTGDKNTTGDPGIVAAGLGSSNRIVNFHAGDLASEGNLGVYGDFAHATQDDRHYLDSCFTNSVTNLMDGDTSGTALHISDVVPHWIEIDFLDFRVPSIFRLHGGTSDYIDWTDVDILTKVDIGDDWTEVATALDLDNDGIDGWRTSAEFSILQPCRYLRIEINATLHGTNTIGAEEIEFFCTNQP